MTLNRRHGLATLGLGAAWLAAPGWVRAQAAPIRILVGFAPGGAADLVARALAEGLRTAGINALVDNRPGAAGRLASDALLAAPADGSTLLFTPSTNLTLVPHVYARQRHEPADFAPIGTVCELDFGLAVGTSSGSGARTLADFLAQAKADPKQGAYGIPGNGTVMHFIGMMLAKQSGVALTPVAYKGGSAALTDAIGGTVPAVITTLPNLVPMHKGGKIRILASSAAQPQPELPEVPTFKSLGFGEIVVSEYFCLVGRKGLPPALVERLNAAVGTAVRAPEVRAVLEKQLFNPSTTAPAALGARLGQELERWGRVVKASGFTPEA